MKHITIAILGFIVILSSCKQDQTAYRNAYKFQVKDYHQAEVSADVQKPEVMTAEAFSASNEIAVPISKPFVSSAQKASNIPANKDLTKKELRQKIRGLKKELKQNPEMAQALKAKFQKAEAAKKSVSVNSKIYIGSIIGLGGLVLIILGGSSAVASIGSLGLLVGVILIVWGLIEQA